MTIATEAIVSGPHIGNGVFSVMSFAFKVFADSDVYVLHTDLNGVDRVAVLNTDYLVTRNSDQDANPGGEITWRVAGVTVPVPAGEKVTISSQVPNTQQTSLPTGGKWAAKTVERMIDKCVILIKQFGRNVTRAIRQPLTDTTVMNELPSALNRRGRYLYFEDTAAAHPTAVAVLSSSAIAISSFIETLLDDVDATAARATLGITMPPTTAYIDTLLDDVNSAAARVTLEILSGVAPANLAATAAAGTNTKAAASDHVHQRPLESIIIAASDETTNLTAGVAKVKFRMPYAFTLVGLPRASLSVANPSGSIFTVDINESGTSVLGTKLTIDNTELTSTTAATAATVTDTALADDAEISVDIDQIGAAGARGLKVTLIGRQS
jgi:hypothetical protein